MEAKDMKSFLTALLKRHGIKPGNLAKIIGVSHATVYRWLIGAAIPDAQSCGKLSTFSGIPLLHILYIAGHIKNDMTDGDNLPALREYIEAKYPKVLPEEMIGAIEWMIDQKQHSKVSQGTS